MKLKHFLVALSILLTLVSGASKAVAAGQVALELIEVTGLGVVSHLIVRLETDFLTDDHILTVRLTERTGNAEFMPYGEQMMPMRHLPVLEATKKEARVILLWEGFRGIAADSRFHACAQVVERKPKKNKEVKEKLVAEVCQDLFPFVNGGYSVEQDAFVRKYDADGNELWARQFGSEEPRSDFALSVAADGDVYVAGWTPGTLPGQTKCVVAPPNSCSDAFLVTYDGGGNELWARQFGGAGTFDRAHGVALDASGTYVAGRTDGTFPGQTRDPFDNTDHGFVRKYDVGANEVWTRQFQLGSSSPTCCTTIANGIAVDASGVYVVGRTSVFDRDAFVRKYDTDGNEVWTRIFEIGTEPEESPRSVRINNWESEG